MCFHSALVRQDCFRDNRIFAVISGCIGCYAHNAAVLKLNIKELKLSKFFLISAKFPDKECGRKLLSRNLYSSRALGLTRVLSLSLSLSRSFFAFSACCFMNPRSSFPFPNICNSRTLASCDTVLRLSYLLRVLSQYLPLDLCSRKAFHLFPV